MKETALSRGPSAWVSLAHCRGLFTKLPADAEQRAAKQTYITPLMREGKDFRRSDKNFEMLELRAIFSLQLRKILLVQ